MSKKERKRREGWWTVLDVVFDVFDLGWLLVRGLFSLIAHLLHGWH